MGKLLLFPLVILVVISLFAIAYGDKSWGVGSLDYPNVGGDGYYVDGGTRLVADENLTAVAEAGFLTWFGYDFDEASWHNDTGIYETVMVNGDNPYSLGWTMETSIGIVPLGFLGIIGVVLVLATVIGVRVVGVGISETSIAAVVQGMAWMSLFLVCSSLSVGYILSIPIFGLVFYTFLTFMYAVGLIAQVNGAGGNEMGSG